MPPIFLFSSQKNWVELGKKQRDVSLSILFKIIGISIPNPNPESRSRSWPPSSASSTSWVISIVITCSTTPLPAIMSHLLISAFSAYRWPLAVLRTCNSHHGQEGDFKIGVMIASPIRFQTLFWSSESTLTETCPAPALRRDVLKKMLFLAMPEQQRTWQKRQNEKKKLTFFLLLLKMSNRERTSSKMCLCTTFCANAWSASRRPFTSWGSLSKAALVGTRRVCPSFSAFSPT